jgi:hypothetical protein
MAMYVLPGIALIPVITQRRTLVRFQVPYQASQPGPFYMNTLVATSDRNTSSWSEGARYHTLVSNIERIKGLCDIPRLPHRSFESRT